MDEMTAGTGGLPDFALDSCRDGIVAISPKGVIRHWNRAATRIFGVERKDILGSNIQNFIPDVDAIIAASQASGADDRHPLVTANAITHHGAPFEAEVSIASDSGDGGIWLTIRNATQRKHYEQMRAQLVQCARLVGQKFIDQSLTVLAEALGVRWVLLCEIDREEGARARVVAFWGDGAQRPGFSYDLAGTPCGNVAADQVCFYPSGVQQLFPTDTLLADMGVESYVGAPLHSSDGNLLGLLAIMHDAPIDEELQPALTLELFAGRAGAELERLHSVSNAERLGRIVEDAASEAFVFDAETLKFILVNKGARDNLGYTMAELRDLTPVDIKPELTAEQFAQLVAPLRDGSQPVLNFETIHRRKDGSDYNVAVTLQLLQDHERPVFYAAIEDITERYAALRNLRETSNRLDTILNNTTMAVFLMNERQQCIYMNDAAEQLSGFSFAETKGRLLHDVIHHTYPDGTPFPIDQCLIDRALPENNRTRGEEVFVHKDGSFYPVFYSASPIRDLTGSAIGTVVEVRNISDEVEARRAREHFNTELQAQVERALAERDAAEAQLRQAQKMEAIGKLTGGVAHDFNNLLQIVGGNLELLARDLGEGHSARHRIDVAMSGVERGARLAQQLLAFSRKQPLNPKPCNLQRLFVGLDDLLRRSLGEQIEVSFTFGRDLWDCRIDEAQLENAILNLAINARDAMAHQGRLIFEVGNMTIEETLPSVDGELLPGDYVVLAVSDSGCGMPRNVQDRIFEPFFTTKELGKGTGLGLSMVYGLMKQSGGHITVYSEEGMGTTFRLYLPRSHQRDDHQPQPVSDDIVGGNEAILVVEDDDDVRITVSAMLRELGYHVYIARDAASGLAVMESGVRVDLLFTDVVMPGKISSRELASRAVELSPDITILFTSGYTENGIIHDGRLDEGIELLSKPYSRGVLARRIRNILDAREEVSAPEAEPKDRAPQTLRLLLVEDEVLIAFAAIDMIAELGHEAVHAPTANAALDHLAAGQFDCVIVDLGLPDIRGEELVELISARWPAQKIVIASGYSASDLSSITDGADPVAFLAKPYDITRLRDILSTLR